MNYIKHTDLNMKFFISALAAVASRMYGTELAAAASHVPVPVVVASYDKVRQIAIVVFTSVVVASCGLCKYFWNHKPDIKKATAEVYQEIQKEKFEKSHREDLVQQIKNLGDQANQSLDSAKRKSQEIEDILDEALK